MTGDRRGQINTSIFLDPDFTLEVSGEKGLTAYVVKKYCGLFVESSIAY